YGHKHQLWPCPTMNASTQQRRISNGVPHKPPWIIVHRLYCRTDLLLYNFALQTLAMRLQLCVLAVVPLTAVASRFNDWTADNLEEQADKQMRKLYVAQGGLYDIIFRPR